MNIRQTNENFMKKKYNKPKTAKEDGSQDYLYAMFSVLSQKSDNHLNKCPPSEDLAAFSEGRLFGRQRKKIMGHLNNCASCRRNWVLTESTLEEIDAFKTNWIKNFFSKLKNIDWRYALFGSGVGLALVTSLLLIFVIPQQNELQKILSQSYADLSSVNVSRFNSFIPKGEDTDLTKNSSKAFLAYDAGMTDGRDRLLNKSGKLVEKKFEENENFLPFFIGQWVVALQCACISSQPLAKAFWPQQALISAKLQSELKNITKTGYETQSMVALVAMLKNATQQIRATSDITSGCDDIAFAIENFENNLKSR